MLNPTSHGAVALHGRLSSPSAISDSLAQTFNGTLAECVVVDEELHVTIGCDDREQLDWVLRIRDLHRQLGRDFGLVSVGHAPPRSGSSAVKRAMVEAVDALRLGERIFGDGHVTSYGDARLGALLFRHVDIQELRWLYERTVGTLLTEDQEYGSELLATLEAYCDSGASIKGTAERLGIHRNTVLYRVRRIRELTMTNLEDGSSRLLLQVGLLAGRLAHTR